MEYTLRNKHLKVQLTDKNYVGEGGEGKLYKNGSNAFKIYFDPSKGLPLGKIDELSVLTKSNIMRPLDVLLDKKNQYVGYMMNFVENAVPLCKLFTNTYRDQNKITHNIVSSLISAMEETIDYIHKHKCLVVDGNEFNYLIDTKTHTIPYFIDTDSWQTPSYPATAILPAIRDLHTPGFNELTDWFSFGIIACQLFVGIHPYKGTHPSFKKTDLEARMRANVSIFNKGTSVPSATRDFSYIPPEYKKWFESLFEKGLRVPPPHVVGVVQIQVKQKVISVPVVFKIDEMISFEHAVMYGAFIGNSLVAKTVDDQVHISKHTAFNVDHNEWVTRTIDTDEPLLVNNIFHTLSVRTPNNDKELVGQATAINICVSDNIIMTRTTPESVTLYTVSNGANNKLFLMPNSTAQILPNATKFFDGCLYMDALGNPYLYVPYTAKNGTVSCAIINAKELQGFRVMDAKHDSGVVMVVAMKNNIYTKFIFRFNPTFTSYDCRTIDDVMFEHPNFTVLSTGTVIHIKEDTCVEVFTKAIGTDVHEISDSGITTNMRLFSAGSRAMFHMGTKIYSISNRK